MTDRIIIALDVPSFAEARQIVDRLPAATFFKVGLQAYLAFGPEIIACLQERGKRCFLDLKFHDIPNTVAGAVRSILPHRPAFTTIHLSGGREMIQAAVEAATAQTDLTILGVTVLTSIAAADLHEMGCEHSPETQVKRLIRLGIDAGLRAFVCSPLEVAPIRAEFGSEITLVTPGIRPAWAAAGDQKRVFTPAEAVAAGSDYLVIGRPVTHHSDPSLAFGLIAAEIAGG